MSSVNRQSLREERDRLEADFSQLAAAGKLNAETDALIRSLLLLLKLLIAVFLERNTVKTRANSGLPDDTTPSQPGRHGKGKALDRTQSDNTRTVETVAISNVACCDHCGEDLRRVRCQGHERRTPIDIVFEKVVEHVDAEIKQCPHCRELSRAPFPTAYAGPIQYGTGVKAYALNLLMMQMVALKRTQQLIQTLVGQLIAESTLLKYVMQLHLALARWEREAIDTLLTLPALHVDETSLRVDRRNHWIHVCSGGEITLKFLHRKRGVEAIEAIGLIPRYRGVLIHD